MTNQQHAPGPQQAPTDQPGGHGGHGGHGDRGDDGRGRTGLDGFYDTLRRPGIMRADDDTWFAGVCVGLARWLGVDALVVRAAFVLLAVFFGMGIALYLVLWLLMPKENGDLSVERALKYGDGGSITLLVVTCISVFSGAPWYGGGDVRGLRAVGFVALVAVGAWFLLRTDTGRDVVRSLRGRGQAPAPTPGAPVAAAPGLSQGNAAANAGATHTGAGDGLGTANGLPYATRPAPERPASAPQRRVLTFGFAGTLVTLGVALAAGAGAWSLAELLDWSGDHAVVAVAAGLAVLGLAFVVGGLLGRRGGLLVPVTLVSIAFVALGGVAPTGLDRPWAVGDDTHVVTTLTGDDHYELGVGDLTLDLTGARVAATTTRPDVVTASLGVGQLDVLVPAGVTVRVEGAGRLGEATCVTKASDSDGDAKSDSDWQARWSRDYTLGQGDPELVVKADLGVGQLRVISPSCPAS
ncbi:PspC domain-containing protein [Terracoccus luteus]|uniref:Phage shock protein C (PspC) family protein n=1 Tax=Terracoccus luteus TaxID=53356 RepID=A0A495XZ08_9MICO|nr:PspC domain-containing protein [Terracoccus luteus]MBB2985652.1 phage shock protein PspC (stress-responsive transcriptional regulator) [Terracoccus luteus]MCP2171304.1 phage shock protein PspC (stress-responsive transcriptional regulator) [Terracoccus luteus]RKT78405.1 phage shock protein C (PspC) family protein [Terracoccus luteus]